MALLAMILMQYRLRRRLARLQKGQSTVGRWMNHQDFHSHYDRMHNRKANETDKSGNSMRTMSSSSNLYSTRASESNGQPGQKSVFTHNRSSSASTSISRTSSASTTRRRPISLSSNPFADSGALELDEDDIIHRSASQAKRYSQAESAISDSNTIMTSDTSTSGRLSSVAPSDQVSSVGNASVVSDDHYHRAKAFTIARGPGSSAPKELGTGQFLNPRAAFLESRR